MAGAKLIVIYPRPTDIEAFDKRYQEEHVPMAVEKLGGKTKIVATKVLGSPQGIPPFHVMAEIHFPSLEALQSAQNPREARKLWLTLFLSLLEEAPSSLWRRSSAITLNRPIDSTGKVRREKGARDWAPLHLAGRQNSGCCPM